MRTSFAVLVALGLLTSAERDVRADSFFHLPCDPGASLSVGGGIFKGHTQASAIGRVDFKRIIVGAPRLELTLFENCGRNSADHLKVTRWWLGRLNVFGALVPERTRLRLHNDEAGTGNTLLEADLHDSLSTSYSVGARISLVDASHFHVEAYLEQTSTFGWREADADSVLAQVNRSPLDVTNWVNTFTEVDYRFKMQTYGLTVGAPIRPNTMPHLNVTPFITVGRMRLAADVEAHITDPGFATTLQGLGVNLDDVMARRSAEKSWWSANGGVRLDIRKSLSTELSIAFSQTHSTAIYVVMLSVSRRFNLPGLEELGAVGIPSGSLPL